LLAAVAVLGATAGLYLTQVGSSAGARPGGHARAQSRPNVVLMMTDDQALAQMSAESMPEVERLLGDGGTRFSRAYLTTPLCCPSRASLLTGQYGHNNGVLRNAYPLLKGKANVLPTWLRRAGYVTAHIGKFMNHYQVGDHPAAVAPGWEQWHTLFGRDEQAYYDYDLSVNGRRVHHGHEPRDYAPRVFNRAAVRMVRRYVPRRRPLFLDIDELAPHPGPGGKGTRCEGNPVPDPRDENRFENAPLPTPPSFNEADVSDKPSFVRSLPRLDSTQIRGITRRYRCGLEALRQVDRTVGRVFREVKRLGELGKTVFIFYTDNGVFLGEHRIRGGKLFPYEEAASTPLMIRVPRRYLGGSHPVGRVSKSVANIDLAPTILRLAHAHPCRSRALPGHGRPFPPQPDCRPIAAVGLRPGDRDRARAQERQRRPLRLPVRRGSRFAAGLDQALASQERHRHQVGQRRQLPHGRLGAVHAQAADQDPPLRRDRRTRPAAAQRLLLRLGSCGSLPAG
jgi:arylsulfatase A-like enzyme